MVGCGARQGDGHSPEQFNQLYIDVTDAWLASPKWRRNGRKLEVVAPLSGEKVDTPMTVLAGDVAKTTTHGNTPQETQQKIAENNREFNAESGKKGWERRSENKKWVQQLLVREEGN